MSDFFPRQTVSWKIEEPPAFRRLTLNVVEMAVMTGVLLRVFRALALTHGPSGSWIYLGGTFAVGSVLLFGMATLHLGNYTLRKWLWRAPAFAAIEALAEALTSLLLIALQREPLGTARAELHNWASITGSIFLWRLVGVVVFAALLAGVVQLVRRWLLKRDDRTHTAEAVHDEVMRVSQEQKRPL
jgi:hypothetical protein